MHSQTYADAHRVFPNSKIYVKDIHGLKILKSKINSSNYKKNYDRSIVVFCIIY